MSLVMNDREVAGVVNNSTVTPRSSGSEMDMGVNRGFGMKSIDQVNVSGSQVSHVGTKIQADVVNVLTKPDVSKNSRRINSTKILILIAVQAIAVAIVVILVQLFEKTHMESYPTPPTLTTTPLTTRSDRTVTTMITTTTPVTTTAPTPKSIETTVPPPEVYGIVDRVVWGGIAPDVSSQNNRFSTVSLDNLLGTRCYTSVDCIEELKAAQGSTALNYNFLIGDDGHAYEAQGWTGYSDYTDNYSFVVAKIAFIGNYSKPVTSLQNATLYYVLNDGLTRNNLRPTFKLIPQCCRNIKAENGPDVQIRDFYAKSFATECYKSNSNCYVVPD